MHVKRFFPDVVNYTCLLFRLAPTSSRLVKSFLLVCLDISFLGKTMLQEVRFHICIPMQSRNIHKTTEKKKMSGGVIYSYSCMIYVIYLNARPIIKGIFS